METAISKRSREEELVLKVKRLKTQNEALRRDVSRSRRVGRTLESDMKRLRRQRQKELSCEYRVRHSLEAREVAVTGREQACTRLNDCLVNLETAFRDEIRVQEQNVVQDTVREIVDRVELLAMTTGVQSTEEELTWAKLQEENLLSFKVWMVENQGGIEELVAAERELQQEREENLATELKSTQQRLQKEEEANDALKEEVSTKSEWLTALSLGCMSLVNVQDQITTRMEAERAELQKKTHELEEKITHVQAENLRRQQTEKKATIQKKKLQAELDSLRDKAKTLEEELKAVKHPLSPLVKAKPERLQTLRSSAKCPRDDKNY